MEENNDKNNKIGISLEEVYNYIFIGIMIITLIVIAVPMLTGVKMAINEIIDIGNGASNGTVGGLYIMLGIFIVPIMLIAIIGFPAAYIILLWITIHKIKNRKEVSGVELIFLIIFYIVMAFMESLFLSQNNSLCYYLAVVSEYGILINFGLLIIINIKNKRKNNESK